MEARVEVNSHDGRGWRVTNWGRPASSTVDAGAFFTLRQAVDGMREAKKDFKEPDFSYRIVKLAPKRSHKNKPRKTALERAQSINLDMGEPARTKAVEKQIQLAVKAAFQRKARKNDR